MSPTNGRRDCLTKLGNEKLLPNGIRTDFYNKIHSFIKSVIMQELLNFALMVKLEKFCDLFWHFN